MSINKMKQSLLLTNPRLMTGVVINGVVYSQLGQHHSCDPEGHAAA